VRIAAAGIRKTRVMMRAGHRRPARKHPKHVKKPHGMRARNARCVEHLVN